MKPSLKLKDVNFFVSHECIAFAILFFSRVSIFETALSKKFLKPAQCVSSHKFYTRSANLKIIQ